MREKLFDYDSKNVVDSYSELSMYYHYFSQDLMSFKFIYKALEIINFIYPKQHPEKAKKLEILALQYADMELIEYAEETLQEALKIYLTFYEEDNINVLVYLFLAYPIIFLTFENSSKEFKSYQDYLLL